MMLAAIDTSSTGYHVGQVLGFVILVVIGVAALTSTRLQGWMKTVILLFVMVALAWNANKLIEGKSPQTWTSAQGDSLRRDFMAGCSAASGSVSYCECLFDRLSSVPPYNTPSGFAGLEGSLERALRTRDVNAVPPAVIGSLRLCRGLAVSVTR
jgi:hypothetical protein